MAVRRLAAAAIQPKDFAFTPDNLAWARQELTKYPEGRQASAVIPLLWRAQEQAGGWVPEAAIRFVGEFLGLPYIRVYEVATFYTMFNLQPVGRFHVQLCGTTPCVLRGAETLKDVCQTRIGEQYHVTADGNLSWVEVECLGACVNAPMAQINYDFYEDLTPESLGRLLDALVAGKSVQPGPQIDRQLSAPVGGPTTLTDPSLYPAPAKNGGPARASARQRGAALQDTRAKRPGEPANIHEAGVPKPPVADSSDRRRK